MEKSLNNRVKVRANQNGSIKLFISNPDENLNGQYFCRMSYKSRTSATIYKLNSNLVQIIN